NQEPAMMDGSHERQSMGSFAGVCHGAGELGLTRVRLQLKHCTPRIQIAKPVCSKNQPKDAIWLTFGCAPRSRAISYGRQAIAIMRLTMALAGCRPSRAHIPDIACCDEKASPDSGRPLLRLLPDRQRFG